MEKLLLFVSKLLQWLESLREALKEIACSFKMPPLPAESTAGPGRLGEFIDKYLGVAVDWDGHFGAQCVDLVRQYWQEVEGIPQPEPTGTDGAIAFFNHHYYRPVQRAHLKLEVYYPGMMPPPGAVIVFAAVPTNRFGHIGICVDADPKGINLFEQNGTANSRAMAEGREQKGAFIGRWDYSRVLGWLVPKDN